MLCGWEGNRRSCVALAMRNRHSSNLTYWLNGLEKGGEHPDCAPLEYYGTFTIVYTWTRMYVADSAVAASY